MAEEQKIDDGAKEAEKTKEIPPEIQKQIQESEISRECMKKIEKILDDANRTLDVSMVLSTKGIQPRVAIKVKPDETIKEVK